MSDYKPKSATYDNSWSDEIGWLATEFEVFEPNPKYDRNRKQPANKDIWPIVVPKKAPPIGDLPKVVQNVLNSTWKYAQPNPNAPRGNVVMGARGMQNPLANSNPTYNPQVRPTKPVLHTATIDNSAIANDWKIFEQIKRTNAVAFRGDTRSPVEVISKQNGFHPPNSRTDRFYLENNIYQAFDSYFQRRYNKPVDKAEFLRAVDSSAPTDADKRLLVDYMMWRKITEHEAVNLGRMVENECLKGYISTSRSIDSSINFGTKQHKQQGWVYLVLVHGGFIVPWKDTTLWGSEEAEIAQWGPIPGERIVGFMKLDIWVPMGPIFIRRTFRKSEPKAFETMFNVMSGMRP